MLTKQDISHLRRAIMGEMLDYVGHAERGSLKPREMEYLEFLKGLRARLDAAWDAAPNAEAARAA